MSTWTAGETTVPNYRARLASLLPAMQLAYLVLLWPLIYARNIVTADLANGPVADAEPFLLNRLFFPGVAAIAVLILVAERHRLARFHVTGFFLLAGLFCYLALAVNWSLAPSTSLSKLVLLGIQVIGLLPSVLLARRIEEVVRPMFWVMVITIVVNLMALLVLPSTPIGHPGIYSHKNTLGEIAALGGMFLLYGVTRSNWRIRMTGLALIPVVLLLFYMSQSKTSLALFLVCPLLAAAAVFTSRFLRISLPVQIVVVAVAAGFLLSGQVGGFSFRDISTLVSGDSTFTGRTEIWDFALSAIAERPMTGYGYQSFWGIGDASSQAQMPDGFLKRTPHAHNGYIDLLLQGGLVALAIFLAMLLMALWWVERVGDEHTGMGYFATTLLFYLMLLNLLETSWLQGLSASSTLTMLFILSASVIRERRMLT